MTHASAPTQNKRQTAARKLKDAESVSDELDTALRARGIVLPSLAVEPLAYGDTDPRPLIDLGRITPTMARKMIDALRKTRP